MLKSVLVPLDQSSLSEMAVPVAATVARRNAAALHLVTAHEGLGWVLAMGQPVAMPGQLDADVHLQKSAYLQAIAARLARESGVVTHWSVLRGPPAIAIDHYVRSHEIDLIVMTTHGRGGLARAWLGSTTDALVRTTNVPLLLLRGETAAPMARFDRVLAALDGSATAEQALATAALLRTCRHCMLLRVVTSTLVYPCHHIPDVEERKREASTYLDCVGDRVRDAFTTIETRVEVGEDVADAILSQVDETGATLVVLGTHARRPVVRALVGSVADKVIRGTDMAVLVAPPAFAESGAAG